MIKPPRATEPWIDFFSVYRDKKPPKTAHFWLFTVIHEKQMFSIGRSNDEFYLSQ